MVTASLVALACVLIFRGILVRRRAEAHHRIEQSYERGSFATALGMARERLDEAPNDRLASLWAARCLTRLGRAERAEPHYEHAGDLELEDWHLRALGLATANRRDEAVDAYEEILDRWPDDVLALRRLAAIRIAQNRPREAIALAERLVEVPGGAVIGHTLRGVVHHDVGEAELAAEALERALELDPELREMPLRPVAMFWAYLAQDLIEIGRADLARERLRRALAGGEDSSLRDLLAQALEAGGMIEEAEEQWRRTSRIDPALASPWLNLGRLALQRGQLGEAVRLLERAVDLAPEAHIAVYQLSIAYRQQGRIEEADRLLERFRELNRPATPYPTDEPPA